MRTISFTPAAIRHQEAGANMSTCNNDVDWTHETPT